MQIVDLTGQHEPLFLACMKGWCSDHLEGGDRKSKWCRKMTGRGMRVKLAIDDVGQPAGMIQYLPIEESNAEGRGMQFIQCIWVHGYRKGIGNVQSRGMGSALLEAAEDDAFRRGAVGMAAWGMDFPDWMPAAWFVKHGYVEADKDGHAVLVWKPLRPHAVAPKWVRPRKKPVAEPGKLIVTVFANGWCQSANVTAERVCTVAAEFAGRIDYREIDTTDRHAFAEWGIENGVFIDDQPLGWPPPTPEQLRETILRRLASL